ncbi:MAG: sodium-dependent transporter [Calditrichaeota bacterium]|nr:MAG: sodium-dependent transporter [Calditrichota bacterium]
MEKTRELFSSRWTLVIAALGMAIGTGNLWRFPRIAAQNGGGAFLIPWLIFLFLWSIPLLMTEFAIGKKTRLGPGAAFGKLIGKKYAWMGAFVAFCTIAIMFYYSVVAGWCMKYTWAAATGELAEIKGTEYWASFSAQPEQTLLFHFLAISFSALIIVRGIKGGIEKATKLLIPGLFFLLIAGVIKVLTLPNAFQGLEFFFKPDWSALGHYKVWLEGLSQSAWSTGAGWGLVMTYAVYMREKEDIALNSCIAGFGNNSASILAGIVIFPAVFALAPLLGLTPQEVLADTGPASTGLTFIWIPELFRTLPMPRVFMTGFFLALTIAAVSSLIAMLELAVRTLIDLGWTRKKATFFAWAAGFILGAPSAINLTFFQNQDWVWGVGLLVSGFFVAFAARKAGISQFRKKFVNTEGNDLHVGKWYDFIVAYLIPIEFAVLIVWWFYQAITSYHPDSWWDPLQPFSVGTCIAQWGGVILLFVIFNNKMYRKSHT